MLNSTRSALVAVAALLLGLGVAAPAQAQPDVMGSVTITSQTCEDLGLGALCSGPLFVRPSYRHLDAEALNVRIVGSEEAVLFDRHLDGGALLDLHTVATVRRNERMGTDAIEVRGETVEP